ncbi:hypothetical protein K1T71_000880 [Dendrolimus kikuchii]|uniref:Uncharacterized protein n=2 Tax=Dendrolimus kikuchii TaxID=765133 RepID=A0ACC1DGL3_9NEOP|nr:hypothetical protein K1T71_014610 [Dendrolimus kikuchii]KAJ0182904.1 hypothetical protein K1T71_000880 [Dendrolimus kikuchii]
MSGRKSMVWTHFEKKDNIFAICKYCKQTLSYKTSTGNLNSHLKKAHASIFLAQKTDVRQLPSNNSDDLTLQANTVRAVTTTSCSSSSVATVSAGSISSDLESSRKRQKTMNLYVTKKITPEERKRIDRDLLELFISDYQPFSMVEDKGFKKFAKNIPGYTLPGRKAISAAMIPALYEKCLAEVKETVTQDIRSVCITTDCWTSSQTESYIAVTAHYIDKDFEPRQVLLECKNMKERHSSANLSQELKRVTDDYGLTTKVIFAISDNARNIEKAIEDLNWKRYGCYAHTLNLIVSYALNPVDVFIENIKKIVAHFKRSTSALDMLLSYQIRNMADSGDPKRLIQQVPTRWNSTYFMLRRFCLLKEAVKHCMAMIDKDWPVISTDEWEIANQLCEVLKPFEEVTSSISGDQYLTGSLVIVMTNCLKAICEDFLEKAEYNHFQSVVKQIVVSLKIGLNDRFPKIEFSKTFALCTLLDPRFKNYGFQNDNAYSEIKKHTHNLIIGLIDRDKKSSLSTKETNNLEDKDVSAWGMFDELIKKKKPQGNATATAIRELQMYLDDEMLPRQNSEGQWNNPSQWWREHKVIYPHLSEIYQTKCNIVATSVPCERLFSKTGLLVSQRRCNLKPRKVEQLAFLNSNLNPKRFDE